MSRSRRKFPKRGIAGKSDKVGKQKANRSLRRAVHVALALGNEDLPILREVSDVWDFDKDGKVWCDGDEKSMRK